MENKEGNTRTKKAIPFWIRDLYRMACLEKAQIIYIELLN